MDFCDVFVILKGREALLRNSPHPGTGEERLTMVLLRTGDVKQGLSDGAEGVKKTGWQGWQSWTCPGLGGERSLETEMISISVNSDIY